jgi:hypothetical protein
MVFEKVEWFRAIKFRLLLRICGPNDLICCILKDLIVRKGYGVFSELVALILFVFVSIYWVPPTNSYEEPYFVFH